jgi:hypothetical protein
MHRNAPARDSRRRKCSSLIISLRLIVPRVSVSNFRRPGGAKNGIHGIGVKAEHREPKCGLAATVNFTESKSDLTLLSVDCMAVSDRRESKFPFLGELRCSHSGVTLFKLIQSRFCLGFRTKIINNTRNQSIRQITISISTRGDTFNRFTSRVRNRIPPREPKRSAN